MNKIFTVAILGAGGRGNGFCHNFGRMTDKYKITAVCDVNPEQIEKVKRNFPDFLADADFYYNEDDFFAEKRADVMVIATYDKDHVRQCIKAMKQGYDILLEKPISNDYDELSELLKVQEETGRNVLVCHELRYGPAYIMLSKLLEDGTVGDLIAIDAFERVAYWHQAQAYVRIQSQVQGVFLSTILAKCSHDLDLVQHYAGSECDTVSSIGGLSFFKSENAPKDSTQHCLDCPHVETCPYSAKRIYIDRWKADGCPAFDWPYSKVSLINPNTEENLYEGIKNTYFGECVFRLGVESNKSVVDHQLVQMQFKNGVTASLKMVFGGVPGRRINFFGTHGEVLMDERREFIEIYRYGEEKEVVEFKNIPEAGHGHGGGDGILVAEMYDVLCGNSKPKTSLRESIESHLMGIAAEDSRLSGGELVKVHKD